MKYLHDTNACIVHLRGTNANVTARLVAAGPTEIALSSVVRAKLRYGADRSSHPAKNHSQLERFFASLPSLPFDEVGRGPASSFAKQWAGVALLVNTDVPLLRVFEKQCGTARKRLLPLAGVGERVCVPLALPVPAGEWHLQPRRLPGNPSPPLRLAIHAA